MTIPSQPRIIARAAFCSSMHYRLFEGNIAQRHKSAEKQDSTANIDKHEYARMQLFASERQKNFRNILVSEKFFASIASW
jgi:hypothetical protein